MEYLLTHRTHPTVDDVYSGLCGRISTLSKTTVYNTLRMFAERQVATMITIDDHHVCYDGDIHPHVHFFCRNCGKVYDLMESDYVERELMLIKAYDSEPRFLRVPVTEWTGTKETLEEGGYCYDHEASATFYVGDGFDWEKFNRKIGGVSSLNVLKTIRSYYATNHPEGVDSQTAPAPKPETVRKLTQAEIAVNMLNKGMSERDVAEKLGMTRDAVRYRIQKAGYVKVCQQTSEGVEKRWVTNRKYDDCLHPKSEVASGLGVCVLGDGFSAPIYISRENPSYGGVSGCSAPKTPALKQASERVSSKDVEPCRDTSDRPSSDDHDHVGESRRVPDGRYALDELAEAVHWCIGEGT